MTYVMSKQMYKEYTTGQKPFTHDELIAHINKVFGLRGRVEHLVVES